ncbi:hypothetical protein GCM10009872_40000 [Actinopolymorpha rutila]
MVRGAKGGNRTAKPAWPQDFCSDLSGQFAPGLAWRRAFASEDPPPDRDVGELANLSAPFPIRGWLNRAVGAFSVSGSCPHLPALGIDLWESPHSSEEARIRGQAPMGQSL